MILALTGNRHKEQIPQVLPAYVGWLRKAGIEFVLSTEFEGIGGLESCEFAPPRQAVKRADVVLSFGGDGTLLNTVKRLDGKETPVLGVNLGGLGYLTHVGPGELEERTRQIIEGRYLIERRMLLEIRTESDDCGGPWYGLNDVVIDKAGYARLIKLRACLDNEYLNTFRADGLILATPTGSTGYNLSAGGPILEPKMEGILLTPLNPHSLSNRPLVVSDDKEIRVEAYSPVEHVNISVDGDTVCTPPSGTPILIRRSRHSAALVNFEGQHFYDILRRKLGWGDVMERRG